MKKHTFALIALTSSLFGASLQADESLINLNLPEECVDRVYVSGFGGVNFLQNFHRHNTKIDTNTGFAVGAAVGYRFDNLIRVEAELAYRHNELKKFHVKGGHSSSKSKDLSGKRNSTCSIMANAYYDFANINCDVCDYSFSPYLGFGIGYAHNRASGSHKRNFETSVIDNGFAYQGMAGVTHMLSAKTLLGLEYKYFVAKHDIKDHSVTVNVKRYF